MTLALVVLLCAACYVVGVYVGVNYAVKRMQRECERAEARLQRARDRVQKRLENAHRN